MAGRPTKFDPLIRRRLLEAIEGGLPQSLACAQCGVGVTTLARWRDRYGDFAAELKEAEARRAQGLVGHIVKAAPKSWQAAA